VDTAAEWAECTKRLQVKKQKQFASRLQSPERKLGAFSMPLEILHRSFVLFCFSERENVPRFRRFPVFGFFFLE
jgi:hypothetical protein